MDSTSDLLVHDSVDPNISVLAGREYAIVQGNRQLDFLFLERAR